MKGLSSVRQERVPNWVHTVAKRKVFFLTLNSPKHRRKCMGKGAQIMEVLQQLTLLRFGLKQMIFKIFPKTDELTLGENFKEVIGFWKNNHNIMVQ
jgi:hypothetical protein